MADVSRCCIGWIGRVLLLAVGARACAALLGSQASLAAPDEEALGKSEGYPICGSLVVPETRCLVGMVSRRDEVYPHRAVAKADRARELKRAAAEPPVRIDYGAYKGTIDDYLARNRTTGLLILKGDTILVERYQYDRTPAHRMTSFSMAKTVVASAGGHRAGGGKHQVARRSRAEVRGRARRNRPMARRRSVIC